MQSIHSLSLTELATQMLHGRISALETTRLTLDRIERTNTKLHSFVCILHEQALQEAKKLDEERIKGRVRGPLHGIPIALKDAFDTKGIRTGVGSKIFKNRVPNRDAEVVRRLKDSGAILIGKTETTEFCFGGPSEDSAFPPARNPWNSQHWTGGSSGGAAAAVSAGLCFGAIGTDTGGSIRLPAAWCGVVGMMPTQSLVSRAGVFQLSKSLDSVGPIAKTISDITKILGAIAPLSSSRAPIADLRGISIALARGCLDRAGPQVQEVVKNAADNAAALGATITEIEGPNVLSHAATQAMITLWEAYNNYKIHLQQERGQLGFFTRSRLSLGSFLDLQEYQRAVDLRATQITDYQKAARNFHIMLMPTTYTPPPLIGESDPYLFLKKPLPTTIANIVGAPAITLPWSIIDGLPSSVQLIGRRDEDCTLLDVAFHLEKSRGVSVGPPSLN